MKRFCLLLLVAVCFLGLRIDAESQEYPIKAIIFDLDGTITDSEPFWLSIHKQMLEKRSITIDKATELELYRAMHGKAAREIAKWMCDRYGLPESIDELIEEFKELSVQKCHGNVPLISGFDAFFEQVKSYPLRYAIATNCGPHSTGVLDKAVDLESRFGEHIYHCGHVAEGKPAPDLYLFAAEKLDVKPHECLVIEDSPTGIAAAQAAGMFCIGLNHGDLEAVEKADLIVEGYHKIDLETLLQMEPAGAAI